MKIPVKIENSYRKYGFLAISSVLLFFIFYDALIEMVRIWTVREEYGHGFFIPVISIFLVWLKKDVLSLMPAKGTWVGVALLTVGLILGVLGNLSTIYVIVQYAFLVTLLGIILAVYGSRITKELWAPLLFLVFMIPLPDFLYRGLSAELQLISSEIGVAVIRLFGISVYLEGNVIDLGSFKLQVVEACSGLNYLFPLMSLAFIAAYFYQAAFWKRAVIFLSSIPVTIFMNSFRIGVIGVLVEYWGKSQAEGFLHDFEGWVIFMACTAILIAEMWLLTRIGKEKKPLREVFGLEFPDPTPKDAEVKYRVIPRQLIVSLFILILTAVGAGVLDKRAEVIPQRADFSDFSMSVGEWNGKKDTIGQIYLDALKLDDYIITNYVKSDDVSTVINFYVAYYASQRAGESAHSPRSCIPGGGWRIKNLSQYNIDGITMGGKPLAVNRLVIKKGEYTQLVYYWFQQRGRNVTSEYLVKWFLFLDALTRNRTDGSLVRLTTFIKPDEELEKGDRRLSNFAKEIFPHLKDYIPE